MSVDFLSADVRHELDDIFFRCGDSIERGTEEYSEFWDFLDKYMKRLSSSAAANQPRSASAVCDPRLRVNFSMTADHDARHRSQRHTAFTADDIAEVRKGMHLYLDFLSKRKFAKISALRTAQAALPMAAFRSKFLDMVRDNQVVLLAGDTGCGKSTQVPQYLMSVGYCRIACTQPRRISAISLCRRVATETLHEYGSQVAFQIRFETNRSVDTKVLFLTEGVLLRQISSDPLLSSYDVVIIDEVHERHLTTDFLLCVVRALCRVRKDLKLILMSATIQTELFVDYFSAPALRVPGRLFPITIDYVSVSEASARPKGADAIDSGRDDERRGRGRGGAGAELTWGQSSAGAGAGDFGVKSTRTLANPPGKTKPLDPTPYMRLLERIDAQFPESERGDLLVFLSGMQEITTLAERVTEYASRTRRWIVLMLHSALSTEEQDRVFDVAPPGVRKCILSTNIAETAVTIDGVRFVCDSGKVKEMGYDSATDTHHLIEGWVSRASAEQRKGRAGRTGPGHCFRMYSEEEFESFQPFSLPEIRRVPLENVALQIKSLALGDPRRFPFIEPPPLVAMQEAMRTLRRQGLVASGPAEGVLPLGAVLANLPVEISVGKMLVLGTLFGLEDAVMTAAAALTVQSPLVRVDENSTAAVLRRDLLSEDGDPFTLLNVYDSWIEVKAQRAENSRKWCRRHGVEEQRLYEMSRLKQQFRSVLTDAGLVARRNRRDDPRADVGDSERRHKRHRLRDLRHERERSRKPRVLTVEGGHSGGAGAGAAGPEEEEDADDAGEVDLIALDFELQYNLDRLAQNSTRHLTQGDAAILKLIIFAGLYPRVALPDPRNGQLPAQEAAFHTRFKASVGAHPSSVFCGQPTLVTPAEMLAFGTLLHTHKPFLTYAMRVPTLPGLLLMAESVDVDRGCTTMLIDHWILLTVTPDRGLALLSLVLRLRALQSAFLAHHLATASQKLLGDEEVDGGVQDGQTVENLEEAPGHLSALPQSLRDAVEWARTEAPGIARTGTASAQLCEGLVQCLLGDSRCDQSRPSKGEVLWRLAHPALGGFHSFRAAAQAVERVRDSPTLSDDDWASVKRGGVRVNEWLRYCAVYSGDVQIAAFSDAMQRPWNCPNCGTHILATLNDLLSHQETCPPRATPVASSSV